MNSREAPSPLRWHTDIIYDESGNQKTIEVHYPIPVYPVVKELKDESSFSDSDVDPYQRFFEVLNLFGFFIVSSFLLGSSIPLNPIFSFNCPFCQRYSIFSQ